MSGNADNFFEWERFPSALKHQIVAGYLTEAFRVLLQHFKTDIVYADLFAGAGRYEDGRPGSPLIAADLAVKWSATGASTRVHCFNVEANPVFFNELQANTASYPPGLVTNRLGRWQDHFGELAQLMRGLPAIVFMDPFRLDVSLEAIADLVQQIGAEARDLILMFNIRGVQRIAHAKAAEDIERGGSVDLGGTPALPASNYFQRPNEVLGGRWWQELLLDGRLPEERFPDLVEGYCEQLRRIGSKDAKAARRALAVPIPYKLGGSTSYYLVLVTRSPKAVVLFSDAADMAISEAWRRREEEERLSRRPAESFLPLFSEDELPPLVESTYELRRNPLIEQMRGEILEYVERISWLSTIRDVHEMLAIRHCGLFREVHVHGLLRGLHDSGDIQLVPNRLRRFTRILPKSVVSKLHA